ncbi:MAG: hypothetical protein KJO38_08285 [Gammaproteobacteria bacterium]|nr:hypothetical protein [Gammaproteobacteria bacterium]
MVIAQRGKVATAPAAPAMTGHNADPDTRYFALPVRSGPRGGACPGPLSPPGKLR